MRKFTLVLALVLSVAGLVVLGSAGAATKQATPKPAGAKLTINSFPEGVFGYLSSADPTCLTNRKVVVYDQHGDRRDPATDRVVGSDRVELDEGAYRYSVETSDSGRFYAQAAAKKGCAAALTGSVEAMPVAAGGGAGATDIPVCSPYTFEGPSEICRLQGLHSKLTGGTFTSCEFGKSSYSCGGTVTGPFPWGAPPAGGQSNTFFNWGPGPNGMRSVVIISEGNETYAGVPGTRMECRISGPDSAGLMVDKAIVQTETGTTEFFTPNLPGQQPGEPGGPLYLNFENGKGTGADAYINGFLYVKR
jgi:hypothetical protein